MRRNSKKIIQIVLLSLTGAGLYVLCSSAILAAAFFLNTPYIQFGGLATGTLLGNVFAIVIFFAFLIILFIILTIITKFKKAKIVKIMLTAISILFSLIFIIKMFLQLNNLDNEANIQGIRNLISFFLLLLYSTVFVIVENILWVLLASFPGITIILTQSKKVNKKALFKKSLYWGLFLFILIYLCLCLWVIYDYQQCVQDGTRACLP